MDADAGLLQDCGATPERRREGGTFVVQRGFLGNLPAKAIALIAGWLRSDGVTEGLISTRTKRASGTRRPCLTGFVLMCYFRFAAGDVVPTMKATI